MAEILKGDSGHHSYAPLSHSQTITICQHLEQMIRELQAGTQELRRDLGHVGRDVAQVRADLGSTNAAVGGLQEKAQNSEVAIESVKKDHARTGSKVLKLGQLLEQQAEQGTKRGEEIKVTSMLLQSTRQEILSIAERVNDVQVKTETQVCNEIAQLKDTLTQASAAMHNLRDDAERTRALQQEQREALRATNAGLQSLGNDVGSNGTMGQALEQRLVGLQGALKTTQQGLQETNAVALKIHEDHKNTKAQLGATQDNLRKCSTSVKKTHEGLVSAVQQLHDTRDQLQRTSTTVEATTAGLERTNAQVHSLGDAQGVFHTEATALRLQLEETSTMVHTVKAGLKETNSIVLPNLQMDNTRPWSTLSPERSLKPLSPISARGGGKNYVPPLTADHRRGRPNEAPEEERPLFTA